MSKTLNTTRALDVLMQRGYRGYSLALGYPGFLLTLTRMDHTEERRHLTADEIAAFFDDLCQEQP